MKILHTCDIHLKNYKDERWQALEEICAVAIREKVDIVVISGDLFDKKTNAEELRPKLRQLFCANTFKVVLLAGNHDEGAYRAGLYFGDDVVILADTYKPFEYKNVKFWGIPFENIESEQIQKKFIQLAQHISYDDDKYNILLYHGELLDGYFSKEDLGDEGELRYMPIKLSYFDNLDIDYVLAGHFHSNFREYKLPKGGYFVYPGSPISITKRELGTRKVNIFECGQPPTSYKLNTPFFLKLEIKLDPFTLKNPLKIIEEHIENLPANAVLLPVIHGYIDSKASGLSEQDLSLKVRELFDSKGIQAPILEFKDISSILEDELFKSFICELELRDYDDQTKINVRELVILAMMMD